ncbi:MAG: hypothetical protein U1F54_15945 [Burkholderiales bacterium]
MADRVAAIDFTKGALVFLMVVYHALNYLGYDTLPHRYLAFVPMSFIMIAGLLIMQLHADVRLSEGTGGRLAWRALKLLLIFTALNIAARAVWSRNHYGSDLSIGEFASNWFHVYVTGDAKAVAFDVLVPIAYTIFLSIAVLTARSVRPYLPAVLAVVICLACVRLNAWGAAITNLTFVSAGIVGLALGTIKLPTIDHYVNSWRVAAAMVAVYLGVLVLDSDNFLSQLLVTVAWLTILYVVGKRMNAGSWLARQFCLLGRYTLVGYIAQIVLLQGVRSINRGALQGDAAYGLIVIACVTILTWASILAIDHGRGRLKVLDRLYRSVFA